MNEKKNKAAKAPATGAALGEFNAADLVASVTGFAEGLKKGTLGDLRTTDVAIPKPLPALNAKQVRSIREKLGASQSVFAALLNVPKRTVICWESEQPSNHRQPSGAALKLLDLVAAHPGLFNPEADVLVSLTNG